MPDWVISMAVNALVQLARDKSQRSKWARALAKVFAEIQAAKVDDPLLAHALTEAEARKSR